MNKFEQAAQRRMVPPSQTRRGKPRGGVIQIHVTRLCDKSCFACTQGSNYKPLEGVQQFITLEQFEQAVVSLKSYFGVVGVFGGNPALHPEFVGLCDVLRKHIPKDRCGLWCNNPISPVKAQAMRETFNPAVSNLNCHLDTKAYDMFKEHWPECRPFGLEDDSRHSPVFVSMKDVLSVKCGWCNGSGEVWADELQTGMTECMECDGTGETWDEEQAWKLIQQCDINQHWSAMVGVFRGELRGWFCEIAGAQSILQQNNPDYPDTGIPVVCNDCEQRWKLPPSDPMAMYERCDTCCGQEWWQHGMEHYWDQVKKHCHECSVPLRGYGELACSTDGTEQISDQYQDFCNPKDSNRRIEVVTTLEELKAQALSKTTDYLGNAKRQNDERDLQ